MIYKAYDYNLVCLLYLWTTRIIFSDEQLRWFNVEKQTLFQPNCKR